MAGRAVPVRDHPLLRAVSHRPAADPRGCRPRNRGGDRRGRVPVRGGGRDGADAAVARRAGRHRRGGGVPLPRGRAAADRPHAAGARVAVRLPEADGLPRRDEPEGVGVRHHLRQGAPHRRAARDGGLAARAAAGAVSRVLLPARRPALPQVPRRIGAQCVLRADAVHDRPRRRHRARVFPGAAEADGHRHGLSRPRARWRSACPARSRSA